jgi:hypothetical protein
VVYLEAPAGVGFSYSNTSSDYNTNDLKTAIDNFNFLENFLLEFPQYISNAVYLAGSEFDILLTFCLRRILCWSLCANGYSADYAKSTVLDLLGTILVISL